MKSPTVLHYSPKLGSADERQLTTVPKTRRLSDASLVRRSQQGDRRAFGALVARYDWRLRGLAHALLLDGAEMDAAMRIAYLRAWRDVVRINAKDDVGAWLYRVTYNACIDQLRRIEAPAGVTAGGIAAGLAALPAADRVAVVLVDREGFPPASAARILGLSPEALAPRLDAAREKLAEHVPTPAAEVPADEAAEIAGTGNGATATAGAATGAGASADDDVPPTDAAGGNGATAGPEPEPEPEVEVEGAEPDAEVEPEIDEAVPAGNAAAGGNGRVTDRGRGRRARRRAKHAAGGPSNDRSDDPTDPGDDVAP